MNPLRKIIQKLGLDLHRYRPKPDYWQHLVDLKIKNILDIGANIGQFAKEAREKLPQAKIYSFEPIKECFEKLETEFKNDPNFKAFNFALGDEVASVKMNKNAYSPSSSLLRLSQNHTDLFPHTKQTSEEPIKVEVLDQVAKNLNLEKEILIKVDVQGFEDKVINGGLETFKKARVVILENSFIELYRGQPLFDDLYQKMKILGFTYKGSLQQKINERTGEVISEDSIFERPKLAA